MTVSNEKMWLRDGYLVVLQPGLRVLDTRGKQLLQVGAARFEVSATGVLFVWAEEYSGSISRKERLVYCAAPGQWGRVELIELTPRAKSESKKAETPK